MDETNTANSSSAAAVADGASAAAHTKTVGATPIISASHVKLLIKSSNQQYEDHVIESDLLWTVKRLKSHLSVVYPSKPPVADQKLIYSGQLLNDNLLLRDVIRSYKDVYTLNHIIHLVYTPKHSPSQDNKSKMSTNSPSNGSGEGNGTTTMPTTDGLRHRHTSDNIDPSQQFTTVNFQQQQQSSLFHQQMHPIFMTPQLMSMAGMPYPQFAQNLAGDITAGPNNVRLMITQQTAMYNWMQQVYSQYMEQYLRYANTLISAAASDTNSSGSSYSTAFSTIPPNFQHLFQQQFPSTVMRPTAAANVAADDAATARQNQEQEQPAQAQVVERFPNLAQEEQDNHDWLENFFSITRLALFLALLYFNASPLRCFVVLIIAGGIYLYHIGVFRLRHEHNNNNLNRNNNAAQNAAVDEIRQGVDQQQNDAAALPEAQQNNENSSEGEQHSEEAETASDTPENVNHESMMSTIRTFVVTFFTSLLPEPPAL